MVRSDPVPLAADIPSLVAALCSRDPMTRRRARQAVTAKRTPAATEALIQALSDRRRLVRWEAAKALIAIRDSEAAPALVRALDDEDQGVRWLAARGLIALGEVGLVAVLRGLTRERRSLEFCQGAHHVLHDLSREGYGMVLAPVLTALEQSEPMFAAPPAAHRALAALATT